MNCLEFRHSVLADPYSQEAASLSDVKAHMETCQQCSRFRQEILDLDSDIEKALAIDVPEGLAARVLLNQSLTTTTSIPTWVRYGMAASFAAALVFGAAIITIGSATPDQVQNPAQNALAEERTDTIFPSGSEADMHSHASLAQHGATGNEMNKAMDINGDPFLAHASHQPHEFYGSEHKPIANEELEILMSQFHLTASIDHVVYAAICPFNGESAAHLVIKDGTDQYTVMLLPERSPGKMYTVDDDLWRGFVSPHPAGALAVLAAAADQTAIDRVREVTDKLQTAIYLTAEL